MKAKSKELFRTICKTLKNAYIAVFYRGAYAKVKFAQIHANNTWKSSESVSGLGSELSSTEAIRKQIPQLLKTLKINSFLDAPCGDFNWMKEIDLTNIHYIGGDIVAALIASNNQKYASANRKFTVLDITNDPLPPADIMLNRDCLVHLSYTDINKFLLNLRAAKIEYILTTTLTKRTDNRDIITGSWRPINLALHPFLFPEPLLLIDEECLEDKGLFPDKALALYRVKNLPDKLVGY